MAFSTEVSRARAGLWRILIPVAVVAALAACTPRTTAERACARGNTALTALKDKDAYDRFDLGLSEAMTAAFDDTPLPRSCAVVVVAQNRISTINLYGEPFELSNPLLDAPGIPSAAEKVIRGRLYVGSISKTITALAAMKLNEEATGGITTGPQVALIDRPLVELYPPVAEVPDWADFSIRDYLAHKSGAAHDPDIDDSALDGLPDFLGPHPGIHPRWAFAAYKDTDPPLVGFEPGETARYSNTGYALAGAAIDWQTVNSPASDEVGYEKYVFRKIALNDSRTTEPTMISMCLGTPWRAPFMDNLVRGYASDGTTEVDPPDHNGWEGPAGGWTMTIGDLGRLMIAMNTNSRISSGSLDQMLVQYGTSELLGINTKWGLGVWRSLDSGGRMVYGKGGNIEGFTSDFVMYRGDGVGAAMVCNQDDVDHLTMRIVLRGIMNACVGSGTKPAYCTPP